MLYGALNFMQSFHHFSIPFLEHMWNLSVPMRGYTTLVSSPFRGRAVTRKWHQQGGICLARTLARCPTPNRTDKGNTVNPTPIKGGGRRPQCMPLCIQGQKTWFMVFELSLLVRQFGNTTSIVPPCFLQVKSARILQIEVVRCFNILYRVRLFSTNQVLWQYKGSMEKAQHHQKALML